MIASAARLYASTSASVLEKGLAARCLSSMTGVVVAKIRRAEVSASSRLTIFSRLAR